ncbi:GNAT family N-acetyltransferase [Bacillus infantis]|uniref:GNAT family N-acetyltransferase n=1 Tax=Bacillus infantis TaxID=324767 RepID=A0A5D4RP12_9BACI|nr:GNAT family protein [Bacillus infantis]TYS52121.1 GNAT family N-acetyltransferase [Bacillus infantis]
MKVRKLEPEDGEAFAELIKDVENESSYMLYGPGERKVSADIQRKMIEALSSRDNAAIFAAEDSGRLAGYLIVNGGMAGRVRHSAALVIGIKKDFRGQGIGYSLFQKLDNWAKEASLHRLELSVVSKNERALALYKKAGFEIEGVKKDSLFIDGNYHDEYIMAKLLK